MVRVRAWVRHHVYKSPHREIRSTRMCVFEIERSLDGLLLLDKCVLKVFEEKNDSV